MEEQLKQWISEICAGNEDSFQRLYDATSADVYRTVRYLLINQQDVEDVVSEVYMALWKSIDQFDQERTFRFWLHGLILRKTQDWRRKSWRRLRIIERRKAFPPEDSYYDQDEILRKESANELFQLLNSLSVKHREVVVMRFFHDYSLEEISNLLHIPVGTVKSRLHTALKKLKREIEGEQILEVGGNHGF